MPNGAVRCGAVGNAQAATPEVQELVDRVRGDAEAKHGKFEKFEAKSFATQVVAGTNFFVKVHTGNEKYVHLRVHRSLPPEQNLTLSAVQANKASDDPIEHFQ
eukprot:Opistho-1_new@36189